jgi:hypothetical protein
MRGISKLSKVQFEKARHFLLTRARKLEAALFLHEFEEASVTEVYKELAAFQNPDGGFGHALEPDLRCEESSVLATTTALQTLAVGQYRNQEMIDRALRYLLNAYDEHRKGWDIIPKEAENAPRAIWWNYGAFDNHWGNPSAEVVGYFNQFPSSDLVDWTAELNRYAIQYLIEDCELNEMSEMQCYLRWADTLTDDSHRQFIEKLDAFVENTIVRDPQERQGYCGYPLMVVHSPDSRYYTKYVDVIPGDLDRLIASQEDDGCWGPNWFWGRYEEVWETAAKTEWQGILTLNALRTLRNYGRLQP